MIDGRPRPDHGDGWLERVCEVCSAGWVGQATDLCGWCERRSEAHTERLRANLLDPPWLRTSTGNPRYDALDDVTKAVWDRTRGQHRATDSVTRWTAELARATSDQLITEHEAQAAIGKATR